MKTLRTAPIALLALVLAVALVGTSCSSVDPVALQVGQWQLSSSDFEDQLDSLADVYESTGQASRAQLEGPTPGSWSTTFTSIVLNQYASFQLAESAAADRDLEVTQDDLDSVQSSLEQTFTAQDGTAYWDQLPEDYRDAAVAGFAAQQVLTADLLENATSDDALRKVFEASQDQYAGEQACVSHILVFAGAADGQTVPSDAEYAEALTKVEGIEDELDGGANFAEVATSTSEDSGSAARGGDLGCGPRGQYVTEFDDAVWTLPVAEVSSPVKTSFGYHLILVRSRGEVTFEDVKDQLAAQVQQSGPDLVAAELGSRVESTDIYVDGRFGQVTPGASRVISVPAGAEQPTPSDEDLQELLGSTAQ